jgi:HEAT repeat protein
MVDADESRVPQAQEMSGEVFNLVVEAALAIRLAGVQFRLYAAESDPVRRDIQVALDKLGELFLHLPSLIIALDDGAISFNGQFVRRADAELAVQDYRVWMTNAGLHALAFMRGVNERELSRFLGTLVTYVPTLQEEEPLVEKLQRLHLLAIKMIPVSAKIGEPVFDQAEPQESRQTFASDEKDVGRLRDLFTCVSESEKSGESDALTAAETELMLDAAENAEALDVQQWRTLAQTMKKISLPARRMLMARLVRWVQTRVNDDRMPTGIDAVLLARVKAEGDTEALHHTLTLTELRMDNLIRFHDWDGMIMLLEALHQRLDCEGVPELRQVIASMLDRIGERVSLRGVVEQTLQQLEELERARTVIMMLGERALRPFINNLKQASVMHERIRMVNMLKEFGSTQLELLLEELRKHNPWYVYRNLLVVLSEIGTEDSLGVVADKMRHSDPRVRAEAVTAAGRIARDRSYPYLVQGLQDTDPDVRARAAVMVGQTPDPRLLALLLKLLKSVWLVKDEPESVQLAATMALGHFRQEAAAREALIQIVYPGLFSQYRRKSDPVRATAIMALASHLPHPAVEALLTHALRDRNNEVRQAAQRVWQRHLTQMETRATV